MDKAQVAHMQVQNNVKGESYKSKLAKIMQLSSLVRVISIQNFSELRVQGTASINHEKYRIIAIYFDNDISNHPSIVLFYMKLRHQVD